MKILIVVHVKQKMVIHNGKSEHFLKAVRDANALRVDCNNIYETNRDRWYRERG